MQTDVISELFKYDVMHNESKTTRNNKYVKNISFMSLKFLQFLKQY